MDADKKFEGTNISFAQIHIRIITAIGEKKERFRHRIEPSSGFFPVYPVSHRGNPKYLVSRGLPSVNPNPTYALA
jgi:hypothetical protein